MRTEPILKDESCDPLLIQPKRIVLALVTGQSAIATPRKNHYRSHRSGGSFGKKGSQRGFILILVPQSSGRSLGPKRKRWLFGLSVEVERKEHERAAEGSKA